MAEKKKGSEIGKSARSKRRKKYWKNNIEPALSRIHAESFDMERKIILIDALTKELDEKNSDEGLFAPDGRKSSWQLAWPDMAGELPILKSKARARLRAEAEAKDKAEFEREKLRAQVEAARQGTNRAQETGMPGSRKRDLEFLEKELDRSQKKATYWEGEANYWKDRCLRCEKDLENHQAEREAIETMLTCYAKETRQADQDAKKAGDSN